MADEDSREGKGPSQALVPAEAPKAPAIQPGDSDEEVLALARREADNVGFAEFRKRVTRHHLAVFGGSVVLADLVLRLVMNGWLDYKTYLPLTISTLVAGVLLKGTRAAVLWWHGRGDKVTVVWKSLKEKQVLAFTRRRVEALNAFASEVGRPELSEGIGKLQAALSSALTVRRTLKRRVARVVSLLRPYGNGVPVPDKLKEQVVALEKHLLRVENGIQSILSGFDILEGKLAVLPYAAQNGDGIQAEINRLLEDIDEHGAILKESRREADEAAKPDP